MYEKAADLCVDSPQSAIRRKLIEALWKTGERVGLSHVFHSALMGFDRIVNQRVGCESTHKSASFSYTSLFWYNKHSNTWLPRMFSLAYLVHASESAGIVALCSKEG